MKWTVYVRGPRPEVGKAPWVRHKSLSEETTEDEVRALVESLARSFTSAKATNGAVEIGRLRRYSFTSRKT